MYNPKVTRNHRLKDLLEGGDLSQLTDAERESFYWLSGQQRSRLKAYPGTKTHDYKYTTWPMRYVVVSVDFHDNIHGMLSMSGGCKVMCETCGGTAHTSVQALQKGKQGWTCKPCVERLKLLRHGTIRRASGYKDIPPCKCGECVAFLRELRRGYEARRQAAIKAMREAKSGAGQKTAGPADLEAQ
jgi:hypothetical protein